MKNLEKELEQTFENNFDCYSEYDQIMAMTKEMFVEIVLKFIENHYCVPAGTEE